MFVLRYEYRQALKSGTIINDADCDEDLLNLKDEINALTEMLLMRDLSPPVTVGILGGWGGGKSYIMHLMQTHMTHIRSQAIKEEEAWGKTKDGYNPDRQHRFVGHIYQIKFDAWTYAKGNLWASLMQTIFLELDRQITLENQITEKLIKEDKSKEEVFCEAWSHWSVLYEASDEDREYMLKKVLPNINWQELQNNKESLLWDEFLWEEYGKVEQQFQERKNKQQAKLSLIEQRQSENQTQIYKIKAKIDQIETDYKKREEYLKSDVQQAIHSSLDITETILINRLGKAGQTVFENIYPQIYVELEKQNIDTRQLDAVLTKVSQKVSQILESGQIKQVVDGKTKTINLTHKAFGQWFKKNSWLITGFAVLGLASVAMPIIVDIILQEKDNISAQIASLIVPLVPAIGVAQKLLISGQKWYSKVESVLIDYKEQLKEYKIKPPEQLLQERRENDPLLKSLSQQTQQLIQVKNNLEIHQIQLEQEASVMEQAIAETEAELPQDQYSTLSSFVRSRIEDNSYQQHLGLMHQIKEDIWKLSKSLLPPKNAAEFKTKLDKLKKVFPRGMARVVVYIDDLDRCPPDAVIEVLEAVQLLVHSPLFIAVLAIDERYINRALAKKYQGVLSLQGRPSAADYLEKIIQIPYRVRPLAEEAIRSYLKAQVVVQDSETSGTKFNEFSPQEFNRLVNCCQEVELSPRSLKRLTNVYKLYKVLSRTRGQKPTREEQTALMVLLAFTGRYPDLMRDIIEKIGSIYEEKRHHADNEEDAITLYQVFQDYVESQENVNKRSINPNITKIKHDFNNLIPKDLKLNQIRTVFDFVRSFSFVGDIGFSNDLPDA
jgi:predicted KAP-like P-loop ATPase